MTEYTHPRTLPTSPAEALKIRVHLTAVGPMSLDVNLHRGQSGGSVLAWGLTPADCLAHLQRLLAEHVIYLGNPNFPPGTPGYSGPPLTVEEKASILRTAEGEIHTVQIHVEHWVKFYNEQEEERLTSRQLAVAHREDEVHG